MLTLAVIPGVALMIVVIIFLRTRHQYQAHRDRLRSEMAKRRRGVLAADEANDQQLVDAIAGTSKALTELLQIFRKERAVIAPGANSSDAAGWTIQDIDQWLSRNAANQAAQIGRRLFYQALLMTVAVLATAGGAATFRYHQVSVAAKPGQIAVEDAVGSFAADPFQQPVPTGAPPATKDP